MDQVAERECFCTEPPPHSPNCPLSKPADRMEEKLDKLDTLLEQTQTLIQALCDENEQLQRDLAQAVIEIERLKNA